MSLGISSQYKDIADKIVAKYGTAFSQIDTDQILFLNEDEKSPKKYADIGVVRSPYTFITNYKFILTVYEPNIIGMTPAQINLLIMHELLHIDDDFEGLLKHDIQDFKFIVATYGVNWDTDPNLPDILADDTEESTK